MYGARLCGTGFDINPHSSPDHRIGPDPRTNAQDKSLGEQYREMFSNHSRRSSDVGRAHGGPGTHFKLGGERFTGDTGHDCGRGVTVRPFVSCCAEPQTAVGRVVTQIIYHYVFLVIVFAMRAAMGHSGTLRRQNYG